ncbi:gluconokinase [Parafrankia sp. EUN1f]|uniref:gluconokinase n=1 Tax=Parafrankia sp. EUN1f TaxID=102897 RepID=UPI00055EE0B0|nr:gluconokinase [Parafrankia sp. EUN1f]
MGTIVVMGVSGCGKSTVAASAARTLGRPFLEGDDLHPPANRARMAAGSPLTDDDRWPWLHLIRAWMVEHPGGVVACSALRRGYRDLLRTAGDVRFVHISVPADVLRQRLTDRTGHWMPASLLDSQLATLEPLTPDEGVILDGQLPLEELLRQLTQLTTHRPTVA